MVAEILKLCGFGVTAAALCVLIKQIKPEGAMFVNIAAGAAILIAVINLLSPSVKAMAALSEKADLSGDFAEILLKALAVCYITSLSADISRDAGETALASKLELAGRAAIALLSLPVFVQLADFVTSILNG